MKYRNYLKTVAQQFERLFSEISAEYNFDYGAEFEVILCRALRAILPQKYGVCRGYVVSEENEIAGDDIVIFDRESFPTLRMFPQDRYDRKNYIPIEAVYAYIEAKYTIALEGRHHQSLYKAWSQVSEVKRVVNLRKPRLPIQYDPYFSFSGQFKIHREDWPEIINPIYGAIVALQVREAKNKPVIRDTDQIYHSLVGLHIDIDPSPDMVIAGNSNVILPISKDSTKEAVFAPSPFFVEEKSESNVWKIDKHAFAVGICTLLWAIDTIRLAPLPWPRILEEGINKRGLY